MSKEAFSIKSFIEKLTKGASPKELLDKLQPKHHSLKPKIPATLVNSEESVETIYNIINLPKETKEILWDEEAKQRLHIYNPNIENYAGTIKIPFGVIGPLRVNGLFASGDYYIPMATTEAALIASYHRGAGIISEAGGATAVMVNEGVSRAPAFILENLGQCAEFIFWAVNHIEDFKKAAMSTTKYGKLIDVKVTLHGNIVFMNFEYTTGDAAGQNMVTIATEAIYQYILSNSPIPFRASYLESNLSGDKKQTAQNFGAVRGKKVTAEVLIPKELLKKHLGIYPKELVEYFELATAGAILSGSLGAQAHMANALAALFMTLGQDVACVGEAATGMTTARLTKEHDFYCAISMPNLIIGTVGGGTALPSQKACLDIMGIPREGGSYILAEIIACTVLGGEISIAAAMATGTFRKAHELLARAKKGHDHKG